MVEVVDLFRVQGEVGEEDHIQVEEEEEVHLLVAVEVVEVHLQEEVVVVEVHNLVEVEEGEAHLPARAVVVAEVGLL